MAIEVNGVTLPDIPADALASYPYAVVLSVIAEDIVIYGIYGASSQMMYAPPDVMGLTYGWLLSESGGSISYTFDESTSSWILDGEEPETVAGMPVGEISGQVADILWTNHDILEVVSFNEDDTAVTGDVWFPNSEVTYASEYRVSSDDLIALATQARRLSGVGGKLTVDQMVEQLTGCDFTLQEKTVTPSDEAQEVTPDSEFYGLSKVTVQPSSGIVLAENERIYQVGNVASSLTLDFDCVCNGEISE